MFALVPAGCCRLPMAVLLCLWCVAGAATAQGIYTCVDAKGRKITADRPIVDCIDREQQELSRQGTVLRKVSPTMTAKEQVVKDEKDKLVAAEQARQQDEKRRDRALLLRYPNRKAHDRERELALAMVDDVIASSEKRTKELLLERVAINTEMEFYVRDPTKAPFALKDRMAINTSNQQEQKQFVITQGAEKARLNRRFDEELQTLQPLWARNAATKP